jgi:hypothetical protein
MLNAPFDSIAQACAAAKFQSLRTRKRWVGLILLALSLCCDATATQLPEMRFRAASVEANGMRLEGFSARLESGGAFELRADRLGSGAGSHWPDLAVTGTVAALSVGEESLLIDARVETLGLGGDLEFRLEAESMAAGLKLDSLDLTGIRRLVDLPEAAEWFTRGRLHSRIDWRQGSGGNGKAIVSGAFEDLAFDSPDGRFAGEALNLVFESRFSAQDIWKPQISARLAGGELLIDEFYRDFSDGGLDLNLSPVWEDRLQFLEFDARDDGALELAGQIQFGKGLSLESVSVGRLELDFPLAYRRYLESAAAAWTLSGLEVTGRMSWRGGWSDGAFASGDLRLHELSIVDVQRRRFAVTGLQADLRPGDHTFGSLLEWRGLLLGKVNLGAGRAALDSAPDRLSLSEQLTLNVLGGRLKLHELILQLPGKEMSEPDFNLVAELEAVDLEQLTAAFGWPVFTGKLSGRIPGVRLAGGVLEVDGQIELDVFDGAIVLGDLRVERPFGVLPSLAANVELSDLDLELLTAAFSFGQISGRLDGYVRELRMLDWSPVAFDAWLGTPAQHKGSNDISRRAVRHLTTIGGGSATAALANPLLRLFSSFSYRRLGLGCRLQNNVCDIRGVSEDDVSVLIMEGAGVPKVTIRAYNRRVDWPQLLAHLVAATTEEAIRVND